ncbi:Adenine deaminase [Emticicia oligotrophica DSM 17448]|uniref:Adenine deaminase n=1 Tax=Emticicia oligotrophica (strain DSM 17448 / CIP 109782 / MTCC 6937 / GPTSA100-15) TaxID=929562 RepID=A0ABM5N5F4_EMTOG|nr:adenine deaminase [Emticicia oligotrophica]AFK04751.1 Adenine deaminase [Emticicia oligotrophica DSM 17448]
MINLSANIVNVFDGTISYGTITIENARIHQINLNGAERVGERYILPGLVDSHVHIESSMLTPAQFARLAVVHGTVGTVSDPHEIANVLGVRGVEFMIEDGKRVPFKFCFGAPSCVPATTFETAGAEISLKDIAYLFSFKKVGYLAEMMNFPGVLNDAPLVLEKIALAHAYNKPVDGHAPGLRGAAAKKYISAGIETDHECFTKAEALEKLKLGMKILIREGSAAKNFEELIPLAEDYYADMMFCSDDKHPDNLVEGHINQLIKRAIKKGIDKFKVLRMATINPILHYRMGIGLLREGDWADFIVVDSLEEFNIEETYINGEKVAEKGVTFIENLQSKEINNFNCEPITASQLKIELPERVNQMRVIEVIDGQLITNELLVKPKVENGFVVSDLDNDVLKIVVLNRYKTSAPSIAFIKNYGLKEGAIASSVGHDSHNIIAVGVDDVSIAEAINLIIREKGGVSAVSNTKKGVLGLPVAGLMSSADGYMVAESYTTIDKFVKEQLKSSLNSPFMSLSFMALLVIPSLKLSDLGLFDGEKFEFVDLFLNE